ncbi:MAG: exodeoxyribonuclease VII small subunit [Clostridiales bacterium]|nr:exodeoxyribonuclease VII small subunit [Clostridiales bacterium]
MEENGFNYEQGIAELEEIVSRLSAGNVPLDDSLKLYSRGLELLNLCDGKLTEVEKKISVLNKKTGEEESFEG